MTLRTMTLRTRLTAAFVLVVLLPLLVVLAVVTLTLPAALSSQQEQGVRSTSRLAASIAMGLCDRARAAAEIGAQAAAATTSADDAALGPDLEELVRRGLADGVRVTLPGGGTAAQAGESPELPPRDCTSGEVAVTGDLV